MAAEPIVDEDYASAEDSDFAPDDAPERDSSESEEDGDGGRAAAGKRKRQAGDGDGDIGHDEFENSGDEAIIEKGRKRRKKATRGVVEDEGGEGGLIKTRRQRAQEKVERKAAALSGPVTVDVDALWAQMTAGPTTPSKAAADKKTHEVAADRSSAPQQDHGTSPSKSSGLADMIKIKRTYNFAGKVHTEEKLVPRDSAEAKLYLESLGENANPDADADDPTPRRMPRKAFRSVFEPIVDQTQRTDLNLGISVRLQARELAKNDAKKLNTVEKSRMDWAGYVDKEGIKDELELAGKSKSSYAERQQFLARSEAKREEDARRARLTGRA